MQDLTIHQEESMDVLSMFPTDPKITALLGLALMYCISLTLRIRHFDYSKQYMNIWAINTPLDNTLRVTNQALWSWVYLIFFFGFFLPHEGRQQPLSLMLLVYTLSFLFCFAANWIQNVSRYFFGVSFLAAQVFCCWKTGVPEINVLGMLQILIGLILATAHDAPYDYEFHPPTYTRAYVAFQNTCISFAVFGGLIVVAGLILGTQVPPAR